MLPAHPLVLPAGTSHAYAATRCASGSRLTAGAGPPSIVTLYRHLSYLGEGLPVHDIVL